MRKSKSLRGRVGGQARLPIQGTDEVSGREADELPVQELVKPDGIQRASLGGEAPDAGIREQGKRNGLASVQVDRRRGRATC